MAKEYIKLWKSYAAYFEPLGAAEVGRLVLAMLEYESTGTASKLDGNERFVWPAIRRDLDEAKDAYEMQSAVNKANGGKGGRRKNQIGFFESEKNRIGSEKTEIDKDKDKDKDKDILSSSAHAREDDLLTGLVDEGMAKVSEAYESNIGLISPSISESMRSYLDLMDADCVVEAIHVACSNNARNWRYIGKVLDNKLSAGVRTMEQWRAQEAERQNTKGAREKTNAINDAWEDGLKMTKQEFSEFWVRLRTLYPYDYRTDSAVPMWVGALREVTADKAEAALKAHYDASPKRAPLPEDIAKSAKSATGGSLLQRAIRAGRGETA